MIPPIVTAPSLPARGSHDQPARRPLSVLCLSGSLGELKLNSLKFARWMQERGWSVTFIGLPDTPLSALADEWAVLAEVLMARRGGGPAAHGIGPDAAAGAAAD